MTSTAEVTFEATMTNFEPYELLGDVETEEAVWSPAAQALLARAKQEIADGKGVRFDTTEDFLGALDTD